MYVPSITNLRHSYIPLNFLSRKIEVQIYLFNLSRHIIYSSISWQNLYKTMIHAMHGILYILHFIIHLFILGIFIQSKKLPKIGRNMQSRVFLQLTKINKTLKCKNAKFLVKNSTVNVITRINQHSKICRYHLALLRKTDKILINFIAVGVIHWQTKS